MMQLAEFILKSQLEPPRQAALPFSFPSSK